MPLLLYVFIFFNISFMTGITRHLLNVLEFWAFWTRFMGPAESIQQQWLWDPAPRSASVGRTQADILINKFYFKYRFIRPPSAEGAE